MSCNYCANKIAGVVGEGAGVPSSGAASTQHCPHCGGFLTAEGVCNNPQCRALSTEVGFGKYRGKTIREILDVDRGYVEWLADEARSPAIRRVAKEALRTQGPNKEAWSFRLNFGKYKGMALEDVYQIAPDYLEWLRDNAYSKKVRAAARSVLLAPPPVDVVRRAKAIAEREGISFDEVYEELIDEERLWRYQEEEWERYCRWRDERIAQASQRLGITPNLFSRLVELYLEWRSSSSDNPEFVKMFPSWDQYANIVWKRLSREVVEREIEQFLHDDASWSVEE